MSSSLAASFTGAKLETPPFLNSVSSSRSSSQYRIFCKPARTRRSLIQRGASLNSRCEVASDALVDTDSTRSSSVSALEQLKTSAADSEFSFPFSFLFLYFWKLICAFGCFSFECDCDLLVRWVFITLLMNSKSVIFFNSNGLSYFECACLVLFC